MTHLPGCISENLVHAQVPLLVLDSSLSLVAGNSLAGKILPQQASSMHGSTLKSLLANPTVLKQVEALLADAGRAWHGELQIIDKNNDAQPFEATLTPLAGYLLLTLWPAQVKAGSVKQLDELTGLPRYDLFLDRIEQGMIAAQRINKSVAILLIGIDQLEQVIDGLGYEAGNELVSQLSKQLSAGIRKTDTLARPASDQFALVMQITSVEDSVLVARKTLKTLARDYDVLGQSVNITASIGICLFPADGNEAEMLVHQAESALRLVRKQGGNSYEFFSKGMNDMARHRIEMENRIRRGLANEEFVVYYQPKVNLLDNAVVGAEALVRWNDPERGLVPPGDFIPVAEETALIGDIGHFVMRKSCEQNMEWQKLGLKPVRISVNVTASQFHDRLILDKVKGVLAATGLEARFLELEITESTLVGDMQKVIEKLHAFRNLGLHISIDDFGTGYSSLSYLSHFPITTLKIDRAFVMDMETNPKTAEITNAIIGLSHGLSLEVVAEGAEIHRHVDMLREKGCDLVQGFYFSRPLPADEFRRVLEVGYLYEHDD
jgi:diguanylate cyclase (GGDEF)-like protein